MNHRQRKKNQKRILGHQMTKKTRKALKRKVKMTKKMMMTTRKMRMRMRIRDCAYL